MHCLYPRTGFDERRRATLERQIPAPVAQADFTARFGDQEFALLLPETPAAAGLKLLDNLRTGLESCPFHFKGARVQMTLSGGLASFAAADRAEPSRCPSAPTEPLYRAKDSGRNRIEAD
ncbi:GGDEF domain-containing protein [Stutzerimonas stutzeri]|uniref:GGDEF domain-containing protein n=1 Tax=Stutzerimonas stutzeri TaxID=316 RepID=UPI00210B8E84|nr:diguanylate cyclase [Stutzerimonas stutzeri]MCQ4318644.1 diguanylate cyclase [Stutzerimonas stutzeri]